MRIVDTHCHLDHAKFQADLLTVLERSREAGVDRLVAIGSGDGPPDLEAAIRLADTHPAIFATVGVHPHDASKATPETFERLRRLAAHPKIVAFGEIGLDYHYDFSPRDVQVLTLVQQMEIASAAHLPIVIHTREAWRDTVGLLKLHWKGRPGIMHCFTGGLDEARQALDLGFHLSIGGVITFPKSDDLRSAARFIPEDRLLVETDAPYLAPVPHRGKRNEPAFLVETLKRLADIRGTDLEHLAKATSANFERLCLPHSKPSGYTGEFHENR